MTGRRTGRPVLTCCAPICACPTSLTQATRLPRRSGLPPGPAAKSATLSSGSSPRTSRRARRCPGRALTSTSRALSLMAVTSLAPQFSGGRSASTAPHSPAATSTSPAPRSPAARQLRRRHVLRRQVSFDASSPAGSVEFSARRHDSPAARSDSDIPRRRVLRRHSLLQRRQVPRRRGQLHWRHVLRRQGRFMNGTFAAATSTSAAEFSGGLTSFLDATFSGGQSASERHVLRQRGQLHRRSRLVTPTRVSLDRHAAPRRDAPQEGRPIPGVGLPGPWPASASRQVRRPPVTNT